MFDSRRPSSKKLGFEDHLDDAPVRILNVFEENPRRFPPHLVGGFNEIGSLSAQRRSGALVSAAVGHHKDRRRVDADPGHRSEGGLEESIIESKNAVEGPGLKKAILNPLQLLGIGAGTEKIVVHSDDQPFVDVKTKLVVSIAVTLNPVVHACTFEPPDEQYTASPVKKMAREYAAAFLMVGNGVVGQQSRNVAVNEGIGNTLAFENTDQPTVLFPVAVIDDRGQDHSRNSA